MIDFRYHALSLVAVFLALGIGIVLGVTIGDSLVSDADQNLRDSLRDDVTDARADLRDEQALAAKRDEVIDATSQSVAEGRLRGISVGLIAIGELPGEIADSVEQAVDESGGDLTRTAVLDPPDAPQARTPRRQRRLGRRIGRLVERGGASPAARGGDSRRFSGSYRGPIEAVVVYRDPPPEPEDDETAHDLDLREAFEEGLLDGLRDNVVGVEATGTDPSQVGWYQDQVIASVDNVNVPAGQLALVLVLGEAALADITGDRPEGSYGYKDSADRALPDLSD